MQALSLPPGHPGIGVGGDGAGAGAAGAVQVAGDFAGQVFPS